MGNYGILVSHLQFEYWYYLAFSNDLHKIKNLLTLLQYLLSLCVLAQLVQFFCYNIDCNAILPCSM